MSNNELGPDAFEKYVMIPQISAENPEPMSGQMTLNPTSHAAFTPIDTEEEGNQKNSKSVIRKLHMQSDAMLSEAEVNQLNGKIGKNLTGEEPFQASIKRGSLQPKNKQVIL